ncbi:GNAT family N-acetyltransferase [Bacillus solimangrovi]|uniref:GNAT family N-acetyltransferase n=1 Tax=Bacillus solimangrovi TaxID=1305675 RepID=UPI001586E18D|nr:GNAT family N-acetyltransferase [Bacillus solimangrovi]
MSEIQILDGSKMEDVIKLSEFAFQYVLSEDQKEKQQSWYGRHKIFGMNDGQNLASKLHLVPLHTYIHGTSYKMGGIAAVATWPEYRRQGMVKQLMIESLRVMKEEGYLLSYLHPFSVSFYRKYGWETLTSVKKYKLPLNKLSFSKTTGSVKRVGSDIPLLNGIYEAYCEQYNGLLQRSEWWWRNRVFSEDEHATVWFDNENNPKGYMIYTVSDKLMKIEEFVHLNVQAQLGLLQFIRNHDSMAEKVEMFMPENDKLSYLLDEPTIEQVTETYYMSRIVDAHSFLKQYPFEQEDGETLFLHISDEYASWNSGTYRIGKNDVEFFPEKKEKKACSQAPKRGIRCDIQTLTTLLLGYQKTSFLYETGKLQGDVSDVKRFEKWIPSKDTYFLDFY